MESKSPQLTNLFSQLSTFIQRDKERIKELEDQLNVMKDEKSQNEQLMCNILEHVKQFRDLTEQATKQGQDYWNKLVVLVDEIRRSKKTDPAIPSASAPNVCPFANIPPTPGSVIAPAIIMPSIVAPSIIKTEQSTVETPLTVLQSISPTNVGQSTIPVERASAELIAPTIPVERASAELIAPTIPVERASTELIAPTPAEIITPASKPLAEYEQKSDESDTSSSSESDSEPESGGAAEGAVYTKPSVATTVPKTPPASPTAWMANIFEKVPNEPASKTVAQTQSAESLKDSALQMQNLLKESSKSNMPSSLPVQSPVETKITLSPVTPMTPSGIEPPRTPVFPLPE
jgi:hypothetical protein